MKEKKTYFHVRIFVSKNKICSKTERYLIKKSQYLIFAIYKRVVIINKSVEAKIAFELKATNF